MSHESQSDRTRSSDKRSTDIQTTEPQQFAKAYVVAPPENADDDDQRLRLAANELGQWLESSLVCEVRAEAEPLAYALLYAIVMGLLFGSIIVLEVGA